MVGVVLEEELDHARNQQRAARDPGLALDERARRNAAHDDFERNHLRAPDEHLVVVVVFAAVEVMGRQPAQIEQAEHARGRLRRDPAFARDLVAPRAVAARRSIDLLDDEHVGLAAAS